MVKVPGSRMCVRSMSRVNSLSNKILHNVVIRTSEDDGGFILFHE